MKRIMILHPEGNINTNPNLTGIVEILCELGYGVDIYGRRHDQLTQEAPCAGARFYVTDFVDPQNIAVLFAPGTSLTGEIISDIKLKYGQYDLVIGVDLGIIEASQIARIIQVPYGLFSYEIYFSEETGADFKQPEVTACRELAFAVCQDRARAAQLSIENQIGIEKILHIPVAGRSIVARRKSYAFHETLGIGREKKIALYMGSTSRCLGTAELYYSTDSWGDSWVLVMHSRYGSIAPAFREHFGHKPKIYYSQFPPLPFKELHQVIAAADVGLAFYTPFAQGTKSTGLNIEHTGMASGKISTYLQHDLPIVVNEMGEMSEHVRNHSLGRVIDDFESLGRVLEGIDERELNNFAGTGHRFFRSHLDLNETIKPLLEVISVLLNRT